MVMRKSYRNRDVEEFIWSCLKLTEQEIAGGVNPKSRTFSGRDIVGFVNTLVNLERVRQVGGGNVEEEGYGDWGVPPKLSVVAKEDDEGDDEEDV